MHQTISLWGDTTKHTLCDALRASSDQETTQKTFTLLVIPESDPFVWVPPPFAIEH